MVVVEKRCGVMYKRVAFRHVSYKVENGGKGWSFYFERDISKSHEFSSMSKSNKPVFECENEVQALTTLKNLLIRSSDSFAESFRQAVTSNNVPVDPVKLGELCDFLALKPTLLLGVLVYCKSLVLTHNCFEDKEFRLNQALYRTLKLSLSNLISSSKSSSDKTMGDLCKITFQLLLKESIKYDISPSTILGPILTDCIPTLDSTLQNQDEIASSTGLFFNPVFINILMKECLSFNPEDQEVLLSKLYANTTPFNDDVLDRYGNDLYGCYVIKQKALRLLNEPSQLNVKNSLSVALGKTGLDAANLFFMLKSSTPSMHDFLKTMDTDISRLSKSFFSPKSVWTYFYTFPKEMMHFNTISNEEYLELYSPKLLSKVLLVGTTIISKTGLNKKSYYVGKETFDKLKSYHNLFLKVEPSILSGVARETDFCTLSNKDTIAAILNYGLSLDPWADDVPCISFFISDVFVPHGETYQYIFNEEEEKTPFIQGISKFILKQAESSCGLPTTQLAKDALLTIWSYLLDDDSLNNFPVNDLLNAVDGPTAIRMIKNLAKNCTSVALSEAMDLLYYYSDNYDNTSFSIDDVVTILKNNGCTNLVDKLADVFALDDTTDYVSRWGEYGDDGRDDAYLSDDMECEVTSLSTCSKDTHDHVALSLAEEPQQKFIILLDTLKHGGIDNLMNYCGEYENKYRDISNYIVNPIIDAIESQLNDSKV